MHEYFKIDNIYYRILHFLYVKFAPSYRTKSFLQIHRAPNLCDLRRCTTPCWALFLILQISYFFLSPTQTNLTLSTPKPTKSVKKVSGIFAWLLPTHNAPNPLIFAVEGRARIHQITDFDDLHLMMQIWCSDFQAGDMWFAKQTYPKG